MVKWYNCYDDSWAGIICPEAFSHPAKMSRGLTNRIFKHALSASWIKPGDVVVDPFGGIGSTGIVGAHLGLWVVCVELEQNFVRMAKGFDCAGLSKKEWVRWYNRFGRNTDICPTCQLKAQTWYEWCSGVIPSAEPHHFVGSFELHRKSIDTFRHFGKPLHPVIIQGDSRKLSEVIAGADCVVGSPPFLGGQALDENEKHKEWWERKKKKDLRDPGTASNIATSYGTGTGQLGAMKPGSIDAVVSSPPYVSGGHHPDQTGAWGGKAQSVPKELAGYGKTPGNLGNLKPGEVDVVVSSPPFENCLQTQDKEFIRKKAVDSGRNPDGFGCIGGMSDYGNTEGQLGADKGETFWAAARQIVSECHKILKPGGHAIWVVKSFVRKGRIVDFPGDWRRLCEAQGFQTVCVHHAMLVKETKHTGLFEEIIETKERKSFFRRLAESKGSPKIDFEVVLCMRKK